MSTREFHYQEGTSSKFWRITVAGQACTVQFGRIGTAGQVQSKTFPDMQAAQAAGDKQIAEKLKKGYREVGVAQDDTHATVTLGTTTPQTQAAPINPQQPAAAPTPAPSAPVRYDPSLRLNLDPIDWFWAPWRRRAPLKRPTAARFDRDAATERLQRLRKGSRWWRCNWKLLPDVVTPEEALFWLQGLESELPITERKLAGVAAGDAESALVLEQAFAIASHVHPIAKQRIIGLLTALYSPQTIMTRLLQPFEKPPYASGGWDADMLHSLLDGFRRYVLPYLSLEERDQLSQLLTPQLTDMHWPLWNREAGHPALYFAAMLGGHYQVLQRIVHRWSDVYYRMYSWEATQQRRQTIIFGLDDPREVEEHVRRLKLPLNEPSYIRAWLAHTEDRALDVVYASIQDEEERETIPALLKTFALVGSPAAAPYMLLLMQETETRTVANAWTDTHPSHTIAGLLPLADSGGPQAEAATDMLRQLVRRGYRDLIEQALATLPEEAAARQHAAIIASEPPSRPPFDQETTPSWLAEVLRSSTDKRTQLPVWARAAELSPIVIGEHVLSGEQTNALLRVMRQGQNSTEHALIQLVKQHADQVSLDNFAWRLFEQWLAHDAPSRENWAFFGLGMLGGDGIVLKLAPLIRIWPGETQHQRAVNGLECLRLIGSDTALMEINSIAQKSKFKGVQKRAVECMERIAEERGLSRAQLEDLLVPDCGLDARGQRIFDYGLRQFRFVLGPDMKPMLRDGQGKLKPNLPPPSTKDDAEKAAQALAEWKLLKRQVSEVAKVQAVRLEQAMVTSRRWSLAEFETLLVRHPLMTHLVQALIWGVYDQQGTLERTFRVPEDQSYADLADQTLELPADAAIGLIHPFYLPNDEHGAWGEILSDYGIMQPFPQLGRAIQRLQAHELSATDMLRFKDLKIPAAALVYGLDKLGWMRDLPGDGGGVCGHFKPFYGSNLTAVIKYEEGFVPGCIVDEYDQKIVYVAVVAGILKAAYWWNHTERLVLGEVDPVVISEVLNDMLVLAAKAT